MFNSPYQSCGYINNDLTLNDREWVCLGCKTKHVRDFKASINILIEGLGILEEILQLLSGSGIESSIKQKQVEVLLLDESMEPETQQSLAGV